MQIAGSTALVTGANRGIGRHFALQLLERGATVYATARNPETVDVPGATVLALDITDPDSVLAAATAAQDVDLLVNNAGISTGAQLVGGDLAEVRREMETHYFGTLSVVRAFAPVLARNGGGAVLNVLSALSWVSFPTTGAYSAAKAAEWALTNGVRLELAEQGTLVSALHLGYTDTDMTAGVDAPKNDPADVVRVALDAVEAGEVEILADETSRSVKGALGAHVSALYPQLAAS
ncbi:short-subunit dehydrogenase [Motilibacter peucedani]|uniref:Short-subunit dehydrogenase n=1 Tax=Motilibacter peucedani TaxID=598650 RepID=A0A420XRD6_9ACTN|nr:short-subunit dehydrogenase [Motilibacter peucedani]